MPDPPKRSLYGDSDAGAAAAPKPLSPMAQVSGVFSEPAKLFARMAERPQWVGALLLCMAFALAFTIVWLTAVDAQEFVAAQLEKSPRQISGDEMARSIEYGAKFMPVASILGVLFGMPVMTFLLGAVYWALGLASGEDPQWRPTYQHGLAVAAVPALATLPYSLLGSLMAAGQQAGTLKPNQMVPSSVGYWVDAESPKLSMLYSSLDLFLLFQYVAIFLAARYAMRSKPWGAALCVVVSLLPPIAGIVTAR